MKQKLIAMLSRTRNSAHLIRALVGAYVAYSCGRVTVAYFTAPDEVTLPMMLGSAAVALCGVAILALALWALAKGYSVEYGGQSPWTMPEDGEDGEDEAEEAQQIPEESKAEAAEPDEKSENAGNAAPAEEPKKDNNQ